MKKVVIVGNGLGARTLFGYLSKDKRYKICGFSVNCSFIKESHIFDIPVVPLEDISEKFNSNDYSIFLGVGYNNLNKNRQALFEMLKRIGYKIESYIHPSAVILNDNKIGEGTMIFAGAVIEPFVEIGSNTMIWSNCVIAHNATLGDNCWIASKTIISGNAKVKNNCFIGINCTISNNVEIAENNIIGAGSLITKSTQENEVYLSRSSEKHRFNAENYSKYFLK